MDLTLDLSQAELDILKDIATEYLDEGGPAFECMREWDEPHEKDDILSLKDKLLGASF